MTTNTFKLVSECDWIPVDAYEGINWVTSPVKIVNTQGNVIFDEVIEHPDYYNENEISIVADKYLCNRAKKKETSLKMLFDRVSEAIGKSGLAQGYFNDEVEMQYFINKLKYYQIRQYFAFNSPVYFNVGLSNKPIASACFILNVEDDIKSIYNMIKLETIIFKFGAGSGQNMSKIRGSMEKLSSGGYASGPVSFLKVADINGGVIKSGGKLRRAAKLAVLDVDHPDIETFINVKVKEEEKLNLLVKNNFKTDLLINDEAFYQNTNISVGAYDKFMKAVENDDVWETKLRVNGKPYKEYKARQLFRKICEAAWKVADPGMMFLDNINRWNTVLNDGRIVSSNPCGEFVFLNNSSCNLASINLIKFIDENNNFNFELFRDVVETVIIAQDIIVDYASYPSDEIAKNAHQYRPLGLGYTNLGALLMLLGLPYESEDGNLAASTITALLTGCAYLTSNKIAKHLGSFERFEANRSSMYNVMNMHIKAVETLPYNQEHKFISTVFKLANQTWKNIEELVQKNEGFRNAAVTLLAPTGTISFLMGAMTTGIEPEFSHVKCKYLVDLDKYISYTHPLLEKAVHRLVKDDLKTKAILDVVLKDGSFKNAPYLSEEQKRIFNTAVSPDGYGIISPMGHLKMTAAVQPFLSMAISKTINLPKDATIDDIESIYFEAWKLGLKGITIYRDGSKTIQPLTTKSKREIPTRVKLPVNHSAKIHKFTIGSLKGYLICGEYDDGQLGEIFINISKQGSTLAGFVDTVGILLSIAMQYGIPLKHLVYKLMNQHFEPAGFTNNPEIRTVSSIIDYIARYIGLQYLSEEEQKEIGLIPSNHSSLKRIEDECEGEHGEPCPECGHLTRKLGRCSFCPNCGYNGGACG